MYDLIILGGGPSGLTAAVYAIRKRLSVLLISPDLGGKTAWHMELPENLERFQVITGDEVVNRFKSEVSYLSFAREADNAELVEVIDGGYSVKTKKGKRFEAKAVVVATGAGGVSLNVPGETEYRMRGLAYSAVSYAPLFIDRIVAIVGEGELGVKSALELAQIARQVYFVFPSTSELESPLGKKLTEATNMVLLSGYKVKEIKGDGTYARSLVIFKGNEERELVVDVIFVEQGLTPNSGLVANLVKLDDKKQIIVDNRNRTSLPGIFAAGDVSDTYAEQVLICIGEGAKAALSAYEYILSL